MHHLLKCGLMACGTLLLAACDMSDFKKDYGVLDKIGFNAGCVDEETTEEDCTCLYEWFEANVPYQTFTSMADEPMPPDAADAISEAVGYCFGAHTMPEEAISDEAS